MKIQKGDAGYLRRRKRLLILEAVVSFGLVAALVIVGYVTTKTKLNLLTVVAVLGCLPASRILVNLIMVMPHDSIDEATELEISAVTEELTVAYDLVITSEKKTMPQSISNPLRSRTSSTRRWSSFSMITKHF